MSDDTRGKSEANGGPVPSEARVPSGTPIGELIPEAARCIGPRLELGLLLLEHFTPQQLRSYRLDRFGVPDVVVRMTAADAESRLQALLAMWQADPANAPREEIDGWLLAIGLTAAHLRDNHIDLGGGLHDLLKLYEFAGEISQVLRYLRGLPPPDPDSFPIHAQAWFIGLVPSMPPVESGRSAGPGIIAPR